MLVVYPSRRAQWPFEDPTGQVLLPPGVAALVSTWRRAGEGVGEDGGAPEPLIAAPRRTELHDSQHIITPPEQALLRRKNLRIKPVQQEQFFNIDIVNEHLNDSDVCAFGFTLHFFITFRPCAG